MHAGGMNEPDIAGDDLSAGLGGFQHIVLIHSLYTAAL